MIKFLTKKTDKITTSAGIIGIFTLISQILAIVKNKIFATQFGASEILDIYNAAFKIPDMIFLFIGMMVSGSILIPFLTEKKSLSDLKYREFISQIFSSFFIISIIISIILFIFMPSLASVFFPGFQNESLEKLIWVSRLMLFSPIIMGLGNIFVSINQKNHSFIPVALTGVSYNIAIIFSVYFFYPYFGIDGLAYGVIFGSILYFLIQLPAIFKHHLFPNKLSVLSKDDFMKYFSKSLPRSLALFIATLIPIFLYSQASKMPSGSITIIQFALSLYFVPIALFTTSYSLASFPKLSNYFFEKKKEEFSRTVSDIISQILFFVVPVAAFFFFFSVEINGVLFGSQKFGLDNIKIISIILSIFSLIIVIQSLNIIFSRILYAAKNTSLTMFSNGLALGTVVISFHLLKSYFSPNLIFLAIIFLFGNVLAFLFLLFSIKIKLGDYLNLRKILFFKKIIISFLAIITTRLIFGIPNLISQQSFWGYFKICILAGSLFIFLFIVFSEILKEKSYIDLKNKVLRYFRKFEK